MVKDNSNNRKISIIVPIYQEDKYIDCCIESIVKQTYSNLEIILVDDGSPDNCPQLCDEWGKKDSRIKVIHKENGGLVTARQAGMQEATGKYIGYVDGDDWIESDMYENMLKVMESEKTDIVITGFKKDLFDKSIECYNNLEEGIYSRNRMVSEIFPTMIYDAGTHQYGLYTYVWNKLFKKEMIFPHQMQVDKRIVIGEDSACVYPTILSCDSIAVTKQTGYHYRQRMNSLLRQNAIWNRNVNQLQIFYKYMIKAFTGQEYEEMLKQQVYNFYINHLIMMSDSLVSICPSLGAGFPFFQEVTGNRIIVYSAGAYGIHVHRQFDESNEFEVVAWVDPDWKQYEESEYCVIDLKEAIKKQYDYLIIASMDKEYINEAKRILQKHDVPMNKIISVYQVLDSAIDLLKREGMVDKNER